MSDTTPTGLRPFVRDVRRSAAPYAERRDELPGRLDAVLLRLQARLRRLFLPGTRAGRRLAEQALLQQERVASLQGEAWRSECELLRRALSKSGFTPSLVARGFALVREAAVRTIGLRHHREQLIGGYAMLQGMLSEMDTGEGKTLTATLTAGVAALAGMRVHVVTVNEYLAARDAREMGPVYRELGLSVGVVLPGADDAARRDAYANDITYCTCKDLGFDYLRDAQALGSRISRGRLLLERLLRRGNRLDRLLLQGLHFAIVDEADSVLVDEARTPLIISGGEQDGRTQIYATALDIVRQLVAGEDFRLDPRDAAIGLTESGRLRLKELAASLPGEWRSLRAREELAQQGLLALHHYRRDVHYIVADGKVQIIDEFTGRILEGRTWERGLQQLIEAKEGCEIKGARSTVARITYQRLFRRYLRLAGMSGTASEVAGELESVYGLRVARVPTHRTVRRINQGVRMYASRGLKWEAVAEAVLRQRAAARPVLVGTRSVADSEELSAVLERLGIEHQLLNARQDSEEAGIIAAAGGPGRVTVATNMAGRGTDIRISPEVEARGGLHVILTEFHESGRIDRQLFGRCGRQGDAGSFEAIISLDDELFLRHASALCALLRRSYAGQQPPLPGWSAWLIRALAQRGAEAANANARRATMDQDRYLETALAFTGQSE